MGKANPPVSFVISSSHKTLLLDGLVLLVQLGGTIPVLETLQSQRLPRKA